MTKLNHHVSPDGLTIDHDDVLLLVRLGAEAGGRVDPNRILRRRPDSRARRAFMEAQDLGWLDGSGHVTDSGRSALATASSRTQQEADRG